MADRQLCPATGKRTYGSRHEAHRRMKSAGTRIRVYFCDCCHGWHVTKEPIGLHR